MRNNLRGHCERNNDSADRTYDLEYKISFDTTNETVDFVAKRVRTPRRNGKK